MESVDIYEKDSNALPYKGNGFGPFVSSGLLMPRMTTVQRNAIVSPAIGLEIYNVTTNELEIYNGGTFVKRGV